VFATASTAGQPLLRSFPASICLVEEACQLREDEAISSYIRYYETLQKVVMVGDPKQLPPCVIIVARERIR